MQNTKRVFCHILPDCAFLSFISIKSVIRENLIEMVLHSLTKDKDEKLYVNTV